MEYFAFMLNRFTSPDRIVLHFSVSFFFSVGVINQSYLTISCSSIADVLLHKHLEISASKSVILGNYPSDYKDLFDGNIVEVNEFMSDDEILSIIDNALINKDKLEEMADRIYDKVRNEHSLDKALESFNYIIKQVIN
jgi:spore maturation protein CgeB